MNNDSAVPHASVTKVGQNGKSATLTAPNGLPAGVAFIGLEQIKNAAGISALTASLSPEPCFKELKPRP